MGIAACRSVCVLSEYDRSVIVAQDWMPAVPLSIAAIVWLFIRQTRDLSDRPNLDRTDTRSGYLRGYSNG